MNPRQPTLPSVLSSSQLPPLPQFSFDYGQGAWDAPFKPNMGLVSDLRSKLMTGELNFDQAANQIIDSASEGGQNLANRVRGGGLGENIKQALVQSFGGQRFQGPEGQTGYFNTKNYGFIPETTKNIVNKTTGYGSTSSTYALGGALPTLPTI